MYAHIRGIITEINDQSCVVDVGGVGYLLFCGAKTLAQVDVNATHTFLVETIVREDMIALYGFINKNDKNMFNLLNSVQGVGFKTALAIQSAMGSDEIMLALSAKDAKAFAKAPGIGPKLAARIVLECASKLQGFISMESVIPGKNNTEKLTGANNILDDAVASLVALGYNRSQAFSAVLKAQDSLKNDNKPQDLNSLIPLALKLLST